MASIFSGKAGRQAAVWTAQQNAQTGNTIDNTYDNALSNGLGELANARDFATTVSSEGLNNSLGAVNSGYGQARQDLTAGYNTGQNYLAGIQGAYQPYAQNGSLASNLLASSYGVNGAAGNTAAQQAFQASPGYQWQVDQATDAAARKAGALGIAGSGNTLDAVTRLGSNLANQEYGNWRTGLSGLAGQGLTAAAGQAQGLALQGNLANSYGTGMAGLDTGQGTAQAGLYTNEATNQANMANTYGQNTATLWGNNAAGKSNALLNLNQSTVQAGQQGLLAGQQAAANQFGALMGGLNLGSQLLGSAFGGTPTAGGGTSSGFMPGLLKTFGLGS